MTFIEKLSKRIVNEYILKNGKNFHEFNEDGELARFVKSEISKLLYIKIKDKIQVNQLVKEINNNLKNVVWNKDYFTQKFRTKFYPQINICDIIQCPDMTTYENTVQKYYIKNYIENFIKTRPVIVEDIKMVTHNVDIVSSSFKDCDTVCLVNSNLDLFYHKNKNIKIAMNLPNKFSADVYILHLEASHDSIQENDIKIYEKIKDISSMISSNGIFVILVDSYRLNNTYNIKRIWEENNLYPVFVYNQSAEMERKLDIESEDNSREIYLEYADVIVLKKGKADKCIFSNFDDFITLSNLKSSIKASLDNEENPYIFDIKIKRIETFSYKDNLRLYRIEKEENDILKNTGLKKISFGEAFKEKQNNNDLPLVISNSKATLRNNKVFFKDENDFRNYLVSELRITDFPDGDKWIEHIERSSSLEWEKIKWEKLLEFHYDSEGTLGEYELDEDTVFGVLLNKFFHITRNNNSVEIYDKKMEKEGNLIQSFCLDEEDKIYNEYDFRVRLSDIILKSYLKTAFITVFVDQNKLVKEFFFHWLQTDTGAAFEEQCAILKKKGESISKQLIVPKIELQNNIIKNINEINQLENKISLLKKNAYSMFDFRNTDEIYTNNDKIIELNEEINQFIFVLPQPLSSIIYNIDCELEVSRKNLFYLKFFEATACFVSIVFLSILYKKDQDEAIKTIKNVFFYQKNEYKNEIELKITFGTWCNLFKVLKDKINNEFLNFIDVNINKLYERIKEANSIRNGYSHKSIQTIDDMKLDLKYYTSLSYKLQKDLELIFHDIDFIYGVGIVKNEDGKKREFYYYGKSMNGHSQKMRAKKFLLPQINIEPNADKIIMKHRKSHLACELLPFILYEQIIENDASFKAAYFLSSIKINKKRNAISKIEWVTYDSPKGDKVSGKDKEEYTYAEKVLTDIIMKAYKMK